MAINIIFRVVLTLLNVIFFLIGLGLIVVGAILKMLFDMVFKDSLDKLAEEIPDIGGSYGAESFSNKPTFDFDKFIGIGSTWLIGIGVVLFIVGFVGIGATCCGQKHCLYAYTFVLASVLLIEIVLFAMVQNGAINNYVKDYFTDAMIKKYKGIDQYTTESLIVTFVMVEKQCCGLESYETFNKSKVFDRKRKIKEEREGQEIEVEVTLATPIACCKIEEGNTAPADEQCAISPTPANSNYMIGCWPIINKLVDDNISPVSGVLLSTMGVTGVCLAMAVKLVLATFDDDKKEEKEEQQQEQEQPQQQQQQQQQQQPDQNYLSHHENQVTQDEFL